MDVCLKREILDKSSNKAILAYVAVVMAGDVEASTAALAARVGVPSAVMLEGLKELSDTFPLIVGRGKGKNKANWMCGEYKPGGTLWNPEDAPALQVETATRFRDFVDDLKVYWDAVNPKIPFSMGGRDGAAIRRFLADHQTWGREHWRAALNHRSHSVVSKSAPFYTWVPTLAEYAAEPLNQFNKPQEGSGSNAKAITREHSNSAARDAAIRSRTQG